jgi:hypothetical protein
VTNRHKARGAIEGSAKVVAIAFFGLASVEGHANAKRSRFGPGLGMECLLGAKDGAESIPRCGEDGKYAVAEGFDEAAVVVLDGLLENGVVASEGSAHGVRVFIPEFSAAFDVGEEEGDGSGWQVHGSFRQKAGWLGVNSLERGDFLLGGKEDRVI